MIKIYTVILVFFSAFCLGQDAERNLINTEQLSGLNVLSTFSDIEINHQRALYLFDEFTKSDLVLNSDNVLKDLPIKIDIHRNQILLMNSKGEIHGLSLTYIKNITVNNILSKDIYEVHQVDGKHIVLRKIYNGVDSSLWQSWTTSVKKADYNPALNVGSREDKIASKVVYMISDSNGDFEQIPTRKKKFINTFNSNAKLFLKKNKKANLKKEEDLIKFVKFLNKK